MQESNAKINYVDCHYGKGMVKVAKILRKPGSQIDDFKEFNVHIQLFGDQFLDSFRVPDNALVVPTDTMKNTVYVLAKQSPMNNPVEFAIDLGEHFLKKYSHVAKCSIQIDEVVWPRIVTNNISSENGFVDKKSYTHRVCLTNDRHELKVKASISQLEILKTRGSSFENYWTDEYTTLQPAKDRICSTKANLTWTYDSFYDLKLLDHNSIFNQVKEIFVIGFANHSDSISVQHSINVIGQSILNSINELKSIDLNLPNVHYLLFNMKQFNMENQNEVFLPTIEPYGNIYATLAKCDHSVQVINDSELNQSRSVLLQVLPSEKCVDFALKQLPFRDIEDLGQKFEQSLFILEQKEVLKMLEFHKSLFSPFVSEFDMEISGELHQLNRLYEEKFAHIFVCALNGKTNEDLKNLIKKRIHNEPLIEINECLSEIRKILHSRLAKILNQNAKKSTIKPLNENESIEKKISFVSRLTSHVLDLSSGKPAEGIRAELHRLEGDKFTFIGQDVTNHDGRMQSLLSSESQMAIGVYKLTYFTEEFFSRKNMECFYPDVEIKFKIKDAAQKYHIPLLLNQFGYSTYRGS
jgi:urate oxidase